jgi:hypothetical protein
MVGGEGGNFGNALAYLESCIVRKDKRRLCGSTLTLTARKIFQQDSRKAADILGNFWAIA